LSSPKPKNQPETSPFEIRLPVWAPNLYIKNQCNDGSQIQGGGRGSTIYDKKPSQKWINNSPTSTFHLQLENQRKKQAKHEPA
jgi:hypothetical protein